MNAVTAHISEQALVTHFPDIEQDLADVNEWMAGAQTRLSLAIEPLTKYAKHIHDLLAAYDDFPRHAARTNTIVELLRTGSPQRPIFIDPKSGIIMAGNHRILAFYITGRKTLPVVYVTTAARTTKAA